MLLWLRYSTIVKLLAIPESKRRHRIGIMTEACSDSRLIVGNKLSDVEMDPQPHEPLEFVEDITQLYPQVSV